MDSWTPAQMKIMKAGGNDKCNSFLHARGVSKQATIQEKYNSDAAALYKEVLKARADGRPEPTSLPPPSSTKTTRNSNISNISSSSGSSSKPSGSLDPNGMERLLGETDEEYIARQTRLRDEAKARMAAKFGSTGGKMGGVGSSPHPGSYQPSGSSSFNMDSIADTLSSGFGSAFCFAKQGISTVQSSAVTKDVASVGYGLWSSLKSGVSEVANVAQNALGEVIPGDGGGNDGMAALNQQMRRERDSRIASSSTKTAYSGFGSEDTFGKDKSTIVSNQSNMNSNKNSTSSFASGSGTSNGYASSSSSVALSSSDHISVAPLPGESNEEYMQRQMRIHQQASSAKTASANSSMSKKSGTKMQVNKDDTDFFSSFGA
jgi:hypothetical protein